MYLQKLKLIIFKNYFENQIFWTICKFNWCEFLRVGDPPCSKAVESALRASSAGELSVQDRLNRLLGLFNWGLLPRPLWSKPVF